MYALQDAKWNITALTDTSGAVIERFAYNPYGQSTVLDANFAPDSDGISDVAWEYRFTSREFDAETGLHHFRARFYHDGLGRFIGRDPLVYPDGYNTYAAWFVPSRLDPQGLDDCNIDIFVGHNFEATDWIDGYKDCPDSQFLGPVGCGLGPSKDETLRDYLEREKPRNMFPMPEWPGELSFVEAPNAMAQVYIKAKEFAAGLCKGKAKRHKCTKGSPEPVCDNVNIRIKCNKDMINLLKTKVNKKGVAIEVDPAHERLCGLGTSTEGESTTTIPCKKGK
jgi:RHS repeat-associated protein